MQAVVKVGEGEVRLEQIEVPKPASGQVLVQVFAAAQNPSDWMKLKRTWPERGVIVGHDFSGVIRELGPDVSSEYRKIGQRVAGFLNACVTVKDGGAFAAYCVADATMLVDLPDDMSFESASTIGLAAFTACQVLWQTQKLPTPLAIAQTPFPILVWGGASAVGQYVIQLAKQSGLQVITTASPQNHKLLESLGADAVFDYRDPSVVSKILAFCGGKPLNTSAVDCISIEESVALVAQCMNDDENSHAHIALVLPVEAKVKHIKAEFTYVYTLLGKPTSDKYAYPALPEHYDLGKWSASLLSHLAKQGILSTIPTRIVPNGLADAQYWINYQEEGKVHAEKIVYRITRSS
ncbi:chaperonin 10-like protein [Lentinula raphanica]|uniref:Chaperonin 10-like protein n=1 Tax=Lentinula raphanica TaxID=153919 RepID=A0AA38PHQ2_9AGAR|nr:chaperonin 10-like protein [Lentinula raphanica]KAJ3973565.1 chaperonin 10-like protein [Lentinula raphanica]